METRWRIELLGGLRAERGPHAVTRFQTHKTAAFLAYLAYHLDRSHPREVLIELLWPDTDPSRGRRSLRVALTSLRHQLEPPGELAAGSVLVADHACVRLNPAAVTTDVAEFSAGLAAAEKASSPVEREQALSQAVERYGGELLPGHYEEWIEPERQRLTTVFVEALRQLAGLLEAAGEPRRALEAARRAAAADPWREEVHLELMRLLADAGQPGAALEHYRELARRLREDLGVAPSTASRTLAQEIQLRMEQSGRRGELENGGGTGQAGAVTPRVTRAPPVLSPTGTVSYLLIDLPGDAGIAAGETERLLRRLRRTLRAGGRAVREAGGCFELAFRSAAEAFACALEVAAPAPTRGRLTADPAGRFLRLALHTGDVAASEGNEASAVLQEARQMLLAAHGGQVLCSEPTVALLRRAVQSGPGWTDLGIYRLRAGRPVVRLYQLALADAAAPRFPPLNAEFASPGTLPVPLTRFFGRASEIERLTAMLAPIHSPAHPFSHSPTRLLTLTGPGGSGKTRLAMEAARALQAAFYGAVWFVPLADLADARLIPGALLDALRLPTHPATPMLEQVAAPLREAPGLLVLDNFEQLLGNPVDDRLAEPGAADGTVLVSELLGLAPQLRCLVTSRCPLGLAGEREFPLSPLPMPDVPDLLERVARSESVQLFVDRAQAVRPDFQLTRANVAAMVQLCHQLEGIPLALELAAARVGTMTPARMAIHMEHRLDFLVSQRRDAPPRHRSLRAAIEWSYHLLPRELQRFFAHLSVFRGGWTPEAAQAVSSSTRPLLHSPSRTADALHQLRDCSLVLAEETSHAEMRFRMLETLREFATEQLGEQEAAAAARCHGEYYLALAERSLPSFANMPERDWLDRMEMERENLRAAMEWLLAIDPARALRLAVATWPFCHMRGCLGEGRRWLDQALAVSDRRVETPAAELPRRATALRAAAALARDQGDYQAAETRCRESLELNRQLADQSGVAASLGLLGLVANEQGDTEAARSLQEQALVLWRELKRPDGVADALLRLGGVAASGADFELAATRVEESLALYRELGNQLYVAVCLRSLGDHALARGDCERATALYEESLEMHRELGSKRDIAGVLVSLGSAVQSLGDRERAHLLVVEGMELFREMGDRPGIAAALEALAELQRLEGDPVRAAQLFASADALSATTGTPIPIYQRVAHTARLGALRRDLGGTAFARAWEDGRALTWQRAADLALHAED